MEAPLVLFFSCALIVAVSARSVSFVGSDGLYRSRQCILDVNNDIPKKNEPLLLTRNPSGVSFELPSAQGRRGVITLNEGQEIYIACTGNRNFIQATRQPISTAVCKSDTTLSINGQDRKFVDLDCNSRPDAVTKVTPRRCANGKGVIVEIGFEAFGWNKLIDVCHNLQQSSTYYSAHIINGAKMAGKVYRKTARPSFDRGSSPLFQGLNPETSYKVKSQQVALTQLLGNQMADALLNQKTNHFLSRGHLAPDGDFLLSPHQFATYFYVNVAPQWQSINGGNWNKLEDDTRRFAERLRADVEVVTGTFGVLRLGGKFGVKDITLERSRIPVPELYWKILRNPRDNSCIAFVATNNPFLKDKPQHICQDICAANKWPSYQNDFSRGYIYCCEYSQIKRAIPEIPDLSCRSTLKAY